jgi:hypothetical protein
MRNFCKLSIVLIFLLSVQGLSKNTKKRSQRFYCSLCIDSTELLHHIVNLDKKGTHIKNLDGIFEFRFIKKDDSITVRLKYQANEYYSPKVSEKDFRNFKFKLIFQIVRDSNLYNQLRIDSFKSDSFIMWNKLCNSELFLGLNNYPDWGSNSEMVLSGIIFFQGEYIVKKIIGFHSN